MAAFAERLQALIGQETVHSWAKRHGLAPNKVWDWIKYDRTPRAPQLRELAERTHIPEAWWRGGDLPPPDPGIVYIKDADSPVPPRQLLSPAPAGRINVEALAAIIEGALKTAPGATPEAIAAHSAKIYAQAIEDGLITPDGLGSAYPGRKP